MVEFEALRPSLSAEHAAGGFPECDPLARSNLSPGYTALATLPRLSFSADTQDQVIQAFQSDVESRMAVISNRTLFFSLWWKSLDDAAAERLMAGSGDYRYWLEEMRHFKPHTLTEARRKGHQYQGRHRCECHCQPIQHAHQSLCLPPGGGW